MGKVAETKPHKDSRGTSFGRILHDTKYKIPCEMFPKIKIAEIWSINHFISITLNNTAREKSTTKKTKEISIVLRFTYIFIFLSSES